MATVLVVAGNYRQAEQWARALDPAGWRYIHHVDLLRGLTSPPSVIAFVGTWQERSDAHEAVLMAQIARRR